MLCAIYRSLLKDGTYLYIEKRDIFDKVPAELMTAFGKPIFVMLLDLSLRPKLAQADIELVKTQLAKHGFYLQVPPPVESLLVGPEEQE